ncbi:MAG: repair protein [Flavipsychrobacter sp.]|jgi:hypothetical protein|nr:repair protein [Flavipsychrobacter sp.]
MAKFITTTAVSHNIESLIKGSIHYTILVAPYMNIHKRLRKVIEQKLSETNIIFVVVCRRDTLKKYDLMWFESQKKIHIINCDNLHAKCYLNEKVAIITSMNLFEYSAVNNVEFGLLLSKEDDNVNYREIYKECLLLIPESDEVKKRLPILNSLFFLTAKELEELFNIP